MRHPGFTQNVLVGMAVDAYASKSSKADWNLSKEFNEPCTADRMAGWLTQEFAEFAHGRDVSERVPGRTPLELPYAIDGDKVGGQSIKYMLNKVCMQAHLTMQLHLQRTILP